MRTIPWPFYVGFLAAVVGNILWFRMQFINKSQGYGFHLVDKSGDLKNFREIIRNEQSGETKKRYELILRGIYACIAMVVLSILGIAAILILQRP